MSTAARPRRAAPRTRRYWPGRAASSGKAQLQVGSSWNACVRISVTTVASPDRAARAPAVRSSLTVAPALVGPRPADGRGRCGPATTRGPQPVGSTRVCTSIARQAVGLGEEPVVVVGQGTAREALLHDRSAAVEQAPELVLLVEERAEQRDRIGDSPKCRSVCSNGLSGRSRRLRPGSSRHKVVSVRRRSRRSTYPLPVFDGRTPSPTTTVPERR